MGAGRLAKGWISALAFLGLARTAAAQGIMVLGDGEATARELAARGHAVTVPTEARALLSRRAGEASDPSPARALAAQGRAAYAQTDFAAATDALERASAAAFTAGPDAFPLAELAAIHLDLGIAQLARGERVDAEREVALALRLDPTLAVDRSLHGPPVWRMVERVRAGQARAPVLPRTLATEPEGGTIQLDTREPAPSPLTLSDLAGGPHVLVARKRGHPVVMTRIDVTDELPSRVAVPMPPQGGPSAARGALEALEAGELEQAATLARLAVGAPVLAILSRAEGLAAVWAPREGPVRPVSAAGPTELVSVLFPEPATRVAARTLRRENPHVAAPAPPPSGGVPWWAWAGGGALIAGVATAAAILLAAPGEPPTEHLLVGELVQP